MFISVWGEASLGRNKRGGRRLFAAKTGPLKFSQVRFFNPADKAMSFSAGSRIFRFAFDHSKASQIGKRFFPERRGQ